MEWSREVDRQLDRQRPQLVRDRYLGVGACETTVQKDRCVVTMAWNQGAFQHGDVSVTTGVQERVRACSRAASTTTTGVGCWIRADLRAPSRPEGSIDGSRCASSLMDAMVMKKEGARASVIWPKKMSPLKRSTKRMPEAREKRLVLTRPGRKYYRSLPFNLMRKRNNLSQRSCTARGSFLTRPAPGRSCSVLRVFLALDLVLILACLVL